MGVQGGGAGQVDGGAAEGGIRIGEGPALHAAGVPEAHRPPRGFARRLSKRMWYLRNTDGG